MPDETPLDDTGLEVILARVDQDLDQSLERLFEFLEIPSISTDPAHVEDCKKAARWTAENMAYSGFQSSVYPTAGQSMVVGRHQPESGANVPHLLFYGHYDVQPADPLDLWDRPPFEPYIAGSGDEARIVARGASDDKGQFWTFFEAARAFVEVRGELPVAVSVLIEGEEESGSPSLAPFLDAHADKLRADFAMVCDTGMWDAQTPAISTRLRGLVAEEVVVTGPARDLHSGMYGGPALNPIGVLARVLASLHNDDGSVAVAGFYDGVDELAPDVKAQWDGLALDEGAFLGDIGLTTPAGEAGYSVLEQLWSRPTLEFNGIVGGYTGEGVKTVIPAQASAKITCRLVGNQDPEKISAALRAHLQARLPVDAEIDFSGGHGDRAIEMPTDAPAFQVTGKALAEEWGRQTAMIGCGGSIPIVDSFKRTLGMDTILVGFALDDDRIHSPNEKYNLRSFRKGIRSWVRILEALGQGTL
ncbi:Acetylornithine deacetylase/Succinyl-diaminopimelate desuccinylase and related deacylases [hydrothermal vent metagenome]|uniref:Acetylornithine deacetylase/Succinyl-diaminopimelate desuccinylase and related deacylases n=1 Tax=hydrothermal vent metagenome TaxID=652676 RepID=A0A3B0TSM2_9ZZZZ